MGQFASVRSSIACPVEVSRFSPAALLDFDPFLRVMLVGKQAECEGMGF